MDFTELVDLASERLGGKVLAANDDFFAPKENLIKARKPVFIEDRYTDVGKWMDGWETRRRRTPGHDWCIVQLGAPGIVRGAVVDTSHFKGNYPEHCSMEACAVEDAPDAQTLANSARWVEIMPKSLLHGDSENRFPILNSERFTHLRLNIFPDGGVARLRVYGEVVPEWEKLPKGDVNLAAALNGGVVLACSDMFFGARHNLILPGPSTGMHDGWETRRRRGPGHDWVVIKLGASGTIRRVEVDTSHFKGNYPESFSLEACDAPSSGLDIGALSSTAWKEVLARTKLQADAKHSYEKEIKGVGEVTHVRLNIFPDGGVARLRVYGSLARSGR